MSLVKVGDINIHYVEDDFAEPWRPHDTVIMQHGFGRSHKLWFAWVPMLARHYRVVRPDLRGHGGSDVPGASFEFGLESFTADFVGFLDQLGLEKVHYVGESLGGILGVAYAARHPDRFKSLVLCSTPCRITEESQSRFARGYPDWPSAVAALGVRGWWTYPEREHADIWSRLQADWWAAEYGATPTHVVRALARFVSKPATDITPLLGQLSVPVLLISPGQSFVTTVEEQAMMANRIPGAQQVIYEEYGHNVYTEIPDECARVALEFIRKHT